MRALILAAGLGSRLAGVAGGLPKPLIPVGGTPVLERVVRWVASGDVERIWVNVHAGRDAVQAVLGDGSRFGVPIHYSWEPELLGTAGAWKHLDREWEGPSLVVYGDNYMHFDLRRLLATHAGAGAAGTVALFDPARHAHTSTGGGHARVDRSGAITEFVESGAAAAPGTLINAGAYVLEASVADGLASGFLDFGHDVLPMLARARQLRAHVLEDGAYCLGIDTPDRLRQAERICREQRVQT